MSDLPKRKPIRTENYDYSTPGAYFITVCTANREKIFWSDRRGELRSPTDIADTGAHSAPLSLSRNPSLA